MVRFLQELDMKQDEYVVFCDSQSAIHLSKKATFHYRTKHIDIRYHWIRETLENLMLLIEKIHIDKNPSDVLTKIVPRDKLDLCRTLIRMDSK